MTMSGAMTNPRQATGTRSMENVRRPVEPDMMLTKNNPTAPTASSTGVITSMSDGRRYTGE